MKKNQYQRKNFETSITKLAEIGRIIGGLIKANPNIKMNKVIIAGIIIDRTYKFVDKGKVYAIIVINLELEDHKENVKIIAKE